MKIVEHNRNEMRMEKKFHIFFGASIFLFVLGVLSAFMFYYENQKLDIITEPLIFSYLIIIIAFILFLLTGKRIITISKMTGELVVGNNRLIKKSKKSYLLKDIECVIRKNKRELRRIYGSNRLIKVVKYYLCLKNARLIPIFSHVSSDNYLFIGKSSIREKEEVLANLNTLLEFLNIKIKSE